MLTLPDHFDYHSLNIPQLNYGQITSDHKESELQLPRSHKSFEAAKAAAESLWDGESKVQLKCEHENMKGANSCKKNKGCKSMAVVQQIYSEET